MRVVSSESKREREVVGDFFIDFYPERREEILEDLSGEKSN